MFLMLFAMAVVVANAQEETDVIKQSAGDKNLELQFDPGAIFNASNGNNVLSNGVGIRFRLFSSETIAYRLNLNLSYENTSVVTQDADSNAGDLELKTKNSSIGISLRPGIEKHFAGTKRLSPYVGAEAIIGYKTSTEKEDVQFTEKYVIKTVNGNLDDGFNLGVGLVAGADFYIAPKLYLGVELNYGLNYFMASKTKYSSTVPNSTGFDSKVGKSNTLTFQPGSMGIFRLGFLF